MKKLENIQVLRGVAAILVLLSHLVRIEQHHGGNTQSLPQFFLSGVIGIDIFFAISGFIMVNITRNKFQLHTARFLYHRIIRIYPLYWFYTTLIVLVVCVNPHLVNQGAPYELFSSYFLLPQKNEPLLAVGWTLTHEMYFYIVFSLFLLFPERFLIRGLLIWAFMITLVPFIISVNVMHYPVLKLIFSPRTYEFIGGAFIAIICHHTRHKKMNYPNLLFAAAVISLILVMINHQFFANLISKSLWWVVLTVGIPSFFMLYFATKAEENGFIFSRFFVVLGDSSYSLYLSHVLILSALGRIVFPLIPDNFIAHILINIFFIAASILFGLLSYHFIEKALQKNLKNLSWTKINIVQPDFK